MRRRLLVSIATLPFLLVLALAAAGIASAGGGCHDAGAVTSAASSSVVKIDGCTFLPTINQVPVGASVTFLNSGTGPHDITGRSSTWGSPMLEPGRSFAHRFAVAGIYAYSCSLHPGMAGMVVVGPIDLELASDVQAAPPSQPATASDGGSPIPVALAGGLGLLGAALGAGFLLRRREQSDQG
jgi:plastocyanin